MFIKFANGDRYEVAHRFSDRRVVINVEGVYVFADRVGPDEWDFSSLPAFEDEKEVFNALVATVETTTKVIPPGGG